MSHVHTNTFVFMASGLKISLATKLWCVLAVINMLKNVICSPVHDQYNCCFLYLAFTLLVQNIQQLFAKHCIHGESDVLFKLLFMCYHFHYGLRTCTNNQTNNMIKVIANLNTSDTAHEIANELILIMYHASNKLFIELLVICNLLPSNMK